MKLWTITVGEPLPIDSGSPRLFRTGLLSEMCADRGHKTTWWSSSFDHMLKRHRVDGSQAIELRDGLTLRLLHGRGYRRNISVSRLIDHWQIARDFQRQVQEIERPDLVLCSFPTIELSVAAVRYGIASGVPVILDIRDLWPDIFSHHMGFARPLMDALLWPYFRGGRYALANATANVAINEGFLEWGLGRAGRARRQFDRVFPMAYPASDPPQEAQVQARDFWRKQGLTQSDETLRVCFFGTLGRQFEFEPVIEVARALSGARVQFVICGTGDRFDDLRNHLRDQPNVVMPGWVGAPEIWMLMRLSHIGLAPYHDEESFTHSLPNKSLEYLSAGLPIVSSLPGALARLLDEQQCGITYQNRDAVALRAALERLRDNPATRSDMARNAKTVFDARFRADAVYADFVTHLEAIAGSRR